MSYPAKYGFPTHKACYNFRNGIRIVSGVAVHLDGPICPSFNAEAWILLDVF